jgi:Uma2 family endonuclease
MDKYFQAGVREYWIVDPDKEVVCVRLFEDGKMTSTHYDKTQTVPVTILEGCEINLNEVFS